MGYQLVKSINAAAIARFHDDAMSVSGEGPRAGTGFKAVWRKIEEDHRCNVLLRSERERAQRHDSRDADRAARRRRIERYEALRHHAVAAMDRELLNVLVRVSPVRVGPGAIALTRMPCAARSTAIAWVSERPPPLEAT